MVDPPLRVAVVGLGFMGATHLRAWQKVSGAKVIGVVSGDDRKLSGDLSQIGGNLEPSAAHFDFSQLKHFGTLNQALNDADIDAVDLCLPTHLHAPAGLAALQAGKHVLLEKPMARTSLEAQGLIAAGEQAGKIVMVGHVLRFFPEWRALADLLKSSQIKAGSFRRNCARPTWSPWLADFTLSGGAPLDLLIHDADFVLHCFGIPESIAAIGVESEHDGIDWLSANCRFSNGNAASISGGWHPEAEYPFSMEFSAITPSQSLDWSSRTAVPSADDPWTTQLQYFTDCARANVPPAVCLPRESAGAVRFVEIMQESRRRNGEALPWKD